MKSKLLRKMTALTITCATILTVFPVGANAQWKSDNTGWWYTEGSSWYTGWKDINGKWYYFNSDGYMAHDTTIDGYYINSNGEWVVNNLNNSSNQVSSNFSWIKKDGNTYFKIKDDDYLKGCWNVDSDIYYFNSDGIMQTGEITMDDGCKYLFGQDGKYIKCIDDDNSKLYAPQGVTTKSNTSNTKVKLLGAIGDNLEIHGVFSKDPEKNENYSTATVNERTINCKTNETIQLGGVTGESVDGRSYIPNQIIKCTSSDNSVAFIGINAEWIISNNGLFYPYIITHKPGKTTMTISVNGTETSFEVIVS